MFCPQCGEKVSGNFCGYCGSAISGSICEATVPTAPSADASTTEGIFSLKKSKMIGAAVYKQVDTQITLSASSLQIDMRIKKMLLAPKEIQRQISSTEISRVQLQTVMDFWDLLYAIISAVLGLFQPALFIITAVCLWCAYGKELIFYLENGEKFQLSTGSQSDAQALLLEIEARRR